MRQPVPLKCQPRTPRNRNSQAYRDTGQGPCSDEDNDDEEEEEEREEEKEEVKEAMEEMDDSHLQCYLSNLGCDYVVFKHNVPSASHMGGVWERQIRTVRNVPISLMHDFGAILDDETLRTFFCEVMAIVNSRLLAVNSLNDPLAAEPLTPNHLLTMRSKIILPPPGNFQKTDLYCQKRWR